MKNIVSFFLLLFSYYVSAQVTFKEGYYINTSKDTIIGLIKDYDWNQNPEKIIFKTNTEASEKVLKPADILGFEIYGKVIYISRETQIDTTKDDVTKLDSSRLPKYETEQVFLKVLERGSANLYSYASVTNSRFFYETENENLQILIFKKYLDNSLKVRENNNFRQQLLNSFNSCDQFSGSSFGNLKYTEKEIKRLFLNYNLCVGESSYSFQRKKTKQAFHFSLRPGLQVNSFSLIDVGFNKFDFDEELSLRFGIEIEYLLPFNNNKWSLIFEPTYQSYSSKKQTPGEIFSREGEVNYSSIELPLGVRYYIFFNPTSQLFINSGVTQEVGIGENELTGSLGRPTVLRGFINPFLGLGFRFKKIFSTEFRYTLPKNLLHRENYNTSNREAKLYSFAFIVGYRIF